MSNALILQFASVNKRMAELLEDARRALRGEGDFGVEQIQKIREPLDEMAPVLAQSADLRRSFPEICPMLDQYKSHLAELQGTLDQLRIMLLAKQAGLLAGRTQLDAATHWIAAFQATR